MNRRPLWTLAALLVAMAPAAAVASPEVLAAVSPGSDATEADVAAEKTASSSVPKLPPLVPRATQLQNIRKVLASIGIFLAAAICLLFAVVGSIALMLAAAVLVPGRVASAERALCSGRWRVVLVGILTTATVLVGAGGAGKLGGPGPLVGLFLLAVLAWFSVSGLAATANLLGARLLGGERAAQRAPWQRVALGGLATTGPLLVPIVGWLYFLYLLCRAVGAGTIALFSSPMPAAPDDETPWVIPHDS